MSETPAIVTEAPKASECQPTEHNFIYSCSVTLPENKTKLFFLCTRCGKLNFEIS